MQIAREILQDFIRFVTSPNETIRTGWRKTRAWLLHPDSKFFRQANVYSRFHSRRSINSMGR